MSANLCPRLCELSVPFFSDQGELEELVEMGDHQSNKVFILHFPADRWHTVLPRSDPVIYVEVIPGPYKAENTHFAPWAPPNDDVAGGLNFLAQLSVLGTADRLLRSSLPWLLGSVPRRACPMRDGWWLPCPGARAAS